MASRRFSKYLPATLLLLAVLPLGASTTNSTRASAYRSITTVRTKTPEAATSLLDSLKREVAQHPNDYVTFETRIAADRFIGQHQEALPETDRFMLLRGISGYWQSKTIVVLPTLPPQATRPAR